MLRKSETQFNNTLVMRKQISRFRQVSQPLTFAK